jgi:hypothetical protein
MKRLIAVVLAAGLSSPAFAQPRCPEGRTLSGACVKPDLAESVRKTVMVFTQPKISQTAPSVLPSEDGTYAPLRDANELRRTFGIDRPVTCTTSGGFASPLVTTCH